MDMRDLKEGVKNAADFAEFPDFGLKKDGTERALMEKVAEVTLATDGVSSMSGTLTDTLKNVPGLNSPVKGVKFSEEEEELVVDLHINVVYPTKIPQLAWDIQTRVKKALTEAGSMPVKEINIHVEGVEAAEERNE